MPRMSLDGIRDGSGASVWRMNLFTPMGTGPTSNSSRIWS